MKYEVYSDASSGLHFAVVCDDGKCSYFFSNKNKEEIPELIEAAKAGEDLTRWGGGEADPQASYEAIVSYVEADDGRVSEVTDEYLTESN